MFGESMPQHMVIVFRNHHMLDDGHTLDYPVKKTSLG
jgi:hypothetical protein